MAAARFPSWAEQSRRGFADQLVASGTEPAHEAELHAAQAVDRLLPDGLATPGHHLWTVHLAGSDSEVGYLWVAVDSRSEGREAYVYDVALHDAHRGRGLGRGTMLAGEATLRELGVDRVSLNVFGHNAPARALYAGLGYRPTATTVVRNLEQTAPWAPPEVPGVRLEPMTPERYLRHRDAAEAEYAQSISDAGMLPVREAREKAAEDYARLLPLGLDTPGRLLCIAWDGSREVATVWLQVADRSQGRQAFCHHLAVDPPLRGRGYGAGVAAAGERALRARGVSTVGATVLGRDRRARALCERAGYEVASEQLRKDLPRG